MLRDLFGELSQEVHEMVNEAAQRIARFLSEKHLKPEVDWIREQIEALTEAEARDSNNVIYKRILECDWKALSGVSFSKLPADLDLKLFNDKKRVFAGSYVLQITGIANISKAIAENVALDDSDDEGDNDNEEVSESELAKLMKGKKTTTKKKDPKKKWTNGKRCLHLGLSDGNKECVAIEYSSIPSLHENLLGAKVRLSGPLEVYAGVILLRPKNIEILSDLTFYPAPQNPPKNPKNPQQQNPQNPKPVIVLDDEDYDNLLMDDLDYPQPEVPDSDLDDELGQLVIDETLPEVVNQQRAQEPPSEDYDSMLMDDFGLDDL